MAAQESNVVALFGGRPSASGEPRISKRALASRWNVSPRTIERYMKRGLPFEKPFENGSVRFVPSEVEAWWRRETA